MMTSPVELGVQRTITEEFILAHPVDVALSRPLLAEDGAGGRTRVTQPPLVPQTFRIVIQGRPVVRRSVDGEEVAPDFVLVGRWDADVQRGDRFTLNGIVHEVVWVDKSSSKSEYESWAEVSSRG